MVTDSQNKALFIFTGVTVIFLPLSFFTSYYGMNVRGIRDSRVTESEFWEICGTAAFAIIGFIAMCAVVYQNGSISRWFTRRVWHSAQAAPLHEAKDLV